VSAYRLTHGSALSEGEAAHLITRAAQGEALTFAPVKVGHRWALAHLATLSAAQVAAHAHRVSLTARLLDGLTVPAHLIA
jgi:hypothetical protein